MTTKEKIEVMQAFEDGKIIQWRNSDGEAWADIPKGIEPYWIWTETDYRIKPIRSKPVDSGYSKPRYNENTELNELMSDVSYRPKVVPASLTELDVMANYSWFRFNSIPLAEEILHAPRSIITKKEGIQILNPTTKCWEDWSK